MLICINSLSSFNLNIIKNKRRSIRKVGKENIFGKILFEILERKIPKSLKKFSKMIFKQFFKSSLKIWH